MADNRSGDRVRVQSHRDLVAWQKAFGLAAAVHAVCRGFPRDEQFSLTSQTRRSAVSVAANIAEGYGRGTTTEYLRFLRVARGSLCELDTHLRCAVAFKYSTEAQCEKAFQGLEETSRVLAGLIRGIEQRKARLAKRPQTSD